MKEMAGDIGISADAYDKIIAPAKAEYERAHDLAYTEYLKNMREEKDKYIKAIGGAGWDDKDFYPSKIKELMFYIRFSYRVRKIERKYNKIMAKADKKYNEARREAVARLKGEAI